MKKNKVEYFTHETSIIDDGAKIGKNTKIWHWCHISQKSNIGKNCIFGQNVFVGENVKIGNNVKIQNNVSIFDGVIIQDDVFIGPGVTFTNVINPRAFVNRKKKYKKTIIQKGSTIGANSTIICGVTLGFYSFVAAGSVVTKNVKKYSLVKGNPAIFYKKVSKNL